MKRIMINFNQTLEKKNEKLYYMYTDSFVSSIITKDIIQDLQNLNDFFDFSNSIINHEKLRKK